LNKLRNKSAYGWSLLSWRRWRGKRTEGRRGRRMKKKWNRSQQREEEVKWPVSTQHTHVIQESTGPRKFQRTLSTLP
jgi:hypothetical protein